MLNKNMNLLQTRFSLVYTRLKEIEKNLDMEYIKINTSGSDTPNLLVNNEQHSFIHDKDNPFNEAEDLIKQYPNPEEYSDILFYGVGLGYHINTFINKYPGLIFSIYEPVPEVFFQFLSQVDLEEFPLSNIKYIFVEDKPDYTGKVAYDFVSQMRDSVSVIDFPAYKEIFPDRYHEFFTQFEAAVNERRSALNTTSAFEKLWTLNSMLNLDNVLSTPNILLERKDHFQNQPAILVGAGPSLEEEIENLRYIKENGLAYIFSAGAAINTLIDNDIHPHAACTYDPSDKNQLVFEKMIKQGITDIPLIFGSSVGYATLGKYPGPKFHMLTSPDKVSPFYLKPREGKIEMINDAPSISAITLQLLIKLGFNPIILTGMNLAYKDNKQHAAGLDYSNTSVSEAQLNSALIVEDVYGNEVLTNPTYNRMKLQIEMFADIYKDISIINTTRSGAKIKGTIFKTLDEVMQDTLKDSVFEEYWLDLKGSNYDINYLKKQYIKINQARDKVAELIDNTKYLLHKIDKQAERGKFRSLVQMYSALENAFAQLKHNEFFHTFIMPMNQLADEVFQLAMLNINREKDNYKQAQKTVIEYEEYIYSCENDIQIITPVFEGMNKAIENYLLEQIKEKAGEIKVLITDFDGILTDGGLYYSESNDVNVKLNSRDKTEIYNLHSKGIVTVVMSKRHSTMLEKAGRQMGIQDIFMDVEDKYLILLQICTNYRVSYEEIAIIIDDAADLELAEKLGLSFAVNDTIEEVKEKVDYICTLKGGEGILRETSQVLLSDSFPVQGTIIR